MAIRINFNSTAVRAHLNLSATDRQLATTLERMSSGLRLTRTADDPASMTLANQFRYHLSGVVQASENVEESIAMIRTGESAMDEINALLNRMRELVLGASNHGSTDQSQKVAYQQELDEAIESVNRIANNTAFGSINLLNGNLADSTLSDDARAFYEHIQHDDTALVNGVLDGSTITINPATAALTRSAVEVTFVGTPAGTTALNGLTQSGTGTPLNVVGETITITGPNGDLDITPTAGTTIDQFASQINAQSNQLGVIADYNETTGVLRIESLHFGANSLDIQSTDVNLTGVGLLDSDATTTANTFLNNAPNQTINVDYTDENGLAQTAVLTQDSSLDDGRTFTGDGFTVTVRDTSTAGINAMIAAAPAAHTAIRESTAGIQNGGLANQRITFEINDMRAGALGHGAFGNTSGYESLQDLLDNQALVTGDPLNTEDALRVIDAAINEVSSERGRLGALESANLEASLDTTRIAIEHMTESESILRDADFALESANYAQQNIRYQAAISMLAQANQLPQSVLQLLQ